VKITCLFFACLLLTGARMVYGHSGTVVSAYLTEGIVPDGDLTDWPTDLPVYPIVHADYGDKPEGPEDLSAHFRIGYDLGENALYIAVEVTDQSVVIAEPDSSSWDNQDGCELFVDSAHLRTGPTLIQYTRHGDQTQVNGRTDDRYDVAVLRTGAKQVYEWRIDIVDAMHPGQSLGFDLSIADKDEDGSFSWLAWGPGTQKLDQVDRVGDLFLVDATTSFGQLMGRIEWQDPSTIPLPGHVRIHSLQNPSMWTQVPVDSTRAYRATVPLGPYTIHTPDIGRLRIDPGPHVHVHVVAERVAQVDLLRVMPLPEPGLIGSEGVLHHFDTLEPDQIDHFVRAYMDFHKIPGLSLALIEDAKVVYHHGYGLQDATEDKKVDATTLFEAASMTKPVFTYAVARLVDRGVLDWDTPLYTYWPYEDIAYDERYKLITARMVVSHTTGFPNWRSGKLEIQFTPGTQFGYSGEGFEYLGKVVSHLTGKSLIDLVQDEVFTPLGMENAYLVWNEESGRPKAMAHMHGKSPQSRRQWDAPNMAASLHIDAKTYAQFLIAVSKGVGLSRATLEEMMTVQTEVPDADASFGLGFSLEESPVGLRFGHGGRNFGFTSESGFYRVGKMGYVLLVNNDEAGVFDRALRAYLITGKTEVGMDE
jgi:CubicO group peptidase (beta-lactamase class C family)